MPNFLLLATSWGPKYGGINSFNMDFAAGLANNLGYQGKVFCAVLSPTPEDIADAEKKRVRLVKIDRPADSPAYDKSWAWDVWQTFKDDYPGEQIGWWVGHDVSTGWAAVEGPVVAGHGQSALIMHMNYASYQAYKGGVGQTAFEKETKQRELFPKANRNFANGPLLRDALKDIVGPDVSMLVPGFANVPVHPSSQCLHVITFGRMDRESDRIKQGGLAVAGFASAVKHASSPANPGLPKELKNRPQMRVIGINKPNGEEERALKKLAFQTAGEQVNLIALPYDENRDQLLKELGRANIALMLSWHEGFGLTGWEAVAGEVPLIVSRDSGLWQLVEDTLGEQRAKGYARTIHVRGKEGGNDAVNFLPEDERDVRDLIIDCAANLEEARKTAAKLKQELKEKWGCTWEHTAEQFLDGLGIEQIQATMAVPGVPTPGNSVPQPTPQPAPHEVPPSGFIAIPRSTWPEDLAARGFKPPDSMLLRPESRIVRFHRFREPLRDEIIDWVLDPDQPIKLRLQAGEGGAGKTRLLIEVCDRLEHSYGWRAGFVQRSRSDPAGLLALLREGKPCLIVLDYAETRTAEIVEITKTALYSPNPPNVRLVLLAREGGDWWDHLDSGAGGDQVVSGILRGLQTKTGPYRMKNEKIERDDPEGIFREALEAFASCKGIEVPPNPAPDLSNELFGNPLFIHLAALATLRGQPSLFDNELLAMAIGHERSYWLQLLSDEGMSEEMLPALEQALALFTLSNGKRTAKEAREVLARTPRLRELDPLVRMKLFDALRKLYPLEGGLAGLRPNLLGETLVSDVLKSDDEVLDAAFGKDCSREDMRSALTMLTRLGHRAPEEERWLRLALERNLTRVSGDALDVGTETGSPMPEILGQVMSAAAPRDRKQTVDSLRVKLPKETLNLRGLKVAILHQWIEFLENKKDKGAKREIGLYEGFLTLSAALKQTGLLAEAADAASKALEHAQIVFRSGNEKDRNRLAMALTNFALHYSAVGRFSQALEKEEKAQKIWRELVAKEPEAYKVQWAISLSDLSEQLMRAGRFDEALQRAEENEEIWRGLAEGQPDAFTAGWAASFTTLCGCLSNVGRFEEALRSAEKAEELRRGLAEKQPDPFTAHWATSLDNLGISLGNVGRFNEALEATEKAEKLLQGLAEKQPDAYTKSWATSLANLGVSLRDVGRFPEALQRAEKAEELRRGLADQQPDAYTADWARALEDLGVFLREIGRFEEALEAEEKAEKLWGGLAEKQPDAYTADWAKSLANLADAHLSANKFNNALDAAKDAISQIRPFADRYPPNYKPWLGYATRIAAESFFKLDRLDEALAEARRSVEIWREVVALRQNYESVQVAKAFRALMKCQIELKQKEAAIESLGQAFNILRKPLNDNPKPVIPVLSELVDLASAVDRGSIARVVPGELLAIVKGASADE